MSQVIWTPQALSDIQRLYRFLALRDSHAARNAIREIRQRVKILAHQPGAGRPVGELSPSWREWPVSFGNNGYVALYRTDDHVVTILAVRHQREDSWG